jgi:hypothetical protein
LNWIERSHIRDEKTDVKTDKATKSNSTLSTYARSTRFSVGT